MDIKVSIYEDGHSDMVRFVIFKERGDMVDVFCPTIHEGSIKWLWNEVDVGEEWPESLRLPKTMTRKGVLQSLADELFRNFAITPTQSTSESEIGAVKNHLEDLRTLVFGFGQLKLERGAPIEEEKQYADTSWDKQEARDE